MNAAKALISEGDSPSMLQVAEAAAVSRRTVYEYFENVEQLLTEAALEDLRPAIERVLEPAQLAGDVESRLDAIVRAIQQGTLENEALLRKMIRLTVDRRAAGDSGSPPRRGYRRVEWIEMALEPVRRRLPKRRFELLVSALSLCIGTEALLVLRDIRGLSAADSQGVCAWAAQALLKAALTSAQSTLGPLQIPRTRGRVRALHGDASSGFSSSSIPGRRRRRQRLGSTKKCN